MTRASWRQACSMSHTQLTDTQAVTEGRRRFCNMYFARSHVVTQSSYAVFCSVWRASFMYSSSSSTYLHGGGATTTYMHFVGVNMMSRGHTWLRKAILLCFVLCGELLFMIVIVTLYIIYPRPFRGHPNDVTLRTILWPIPLADRISA